MKSSRKSRIMSRISYLAGTIGLGALMSVTPPTFAQVDTTTTVDQAGNAVGQVTGQVPGVVGQVGQTAGQTVGQVGTTAGNVVGGLQPVGQGVGSALTNLTQPQTVQSLLEFLASVIPNHIEAHVNLDALRVERLTVDVRGVDLRNLRVDLLVANSRSAGQVRPAMGPGSTSATMQPGGTSGTMQLPGDVPITGSSTRGTR